MKLSFFLAKIFFKYLILQFEILQKYFRDISCRNLIKISQPPLVQERLSLNREMLAGLLASSRLEANRIQRLGVEEEEARPKSRKRILLLISVPLILSLLLSLLLLI